MGLRAEGKDIWWKCGGGILGETEGGKAQFEGFGGELGAGGKAVSGGRCGRWACIGLRRLRDRGTKGKGWSLERAGIEGRKMAFRGGEWSVWNLAQGLRKVKGWLLGGCNDALRMAYLDAGRGATGKNRVDLGEEC